MSVGTINSKFIAGFRLHTGFFETRFRGYSFLNYFVPVVDYRISEFYLYKTFIFYTVCSPKPAMPIIIRCKLILYAEVVCLDNR